MAKKKPMTNREYVLMITKGDGWATTCPFCRGHNTSGDDGEFKCEDCNQRWATEMKYAGYFQLDEEEEDES